MLTITALVLLCSGCERSESEPEAEVPAGEETDESAVHGADQEIDAAGASPEPSSEGRANAVQTELENIEVENPEGDESGTAEATLTATDIERFEPGQTERIGTLSYFDIAAFESANRLREQGEALHRDGVKRLALIHCDAQCVEVLNEAGAFDALVELRIAECADANTVGAYISTGGHPNLRYLALEGCYGYSDESIGEATAVMRSEQVRELVDLPNLQGLVSLSLARQNLCPDALGALTTEETLPRLGALDLSINSCLDDAGLADFFESANRQQLRYLNLRRTGTGEVALSTLLDSAAFENLEELQLDNGDGLPDDLVNEIHEFVPGCQP